MGVLIGIILGTARTYNFYMKMLEGIPNNADFCTFASMRMRFARIANTRPDTELEI